VLSDLFVLDGLIDRWMLAMVNKSEGAWGGKALA